MPHQPRSSRPSLSSLLPHISPFPPPFHLDITAAATSWSTSPCSSGRPMLAKPHLSCEATTRLLRVRASVGTLDNVNVMRRSLRLDPYGESTIMRPLRGIPAPASTSNDVPSPASLPLNPGLWAPTAGNRRHPLQRHAGPGLRSENSALCGARLRVAVLSSGGVDNNVALHLFHATGCTCIFCSSEDQKNEQPCQPPTSEDVAAFVICSLWFLLASLLLLFFAYIS